MCVPTRALSPALTGAAAAFATAATLAGCDHSCLDIACQDEVTIEFSPHISSAGHYRFEIIADGRAQTCELDFEPSRGQRLPEECRGLWISGTDVPGPRGGVIEGPPYRILSWSSAPLEQLQLTILRDGALWNTGTFAPKYRQVHRYDSCSTCTFASERLSLP